MIICTHILTFLTFQQNCYQVWCVHILLIDILVSELVSVRYFYCVDSDTKEFQDMAQEPYILLAYRNPTMEVVVSNDNIKYFITSV